MTAQLGDGLGGSAIPGRLVAGLGEYAGIWDPAAVTSFPALAPITSWKGGQAGARREGSQTAPPMAGRQLAAFSHLKPECVLRLCFVSFLFQDLIRRVGLAGAAQPSLGLLFY